MKVAVVLIVVAVTVCAMVQESEQMYFKDIAAQRVEMPDISGVLENVKTDFDKKIENVHKDFEDVHEGLKKMHKKFEDVHEVLKNVHEGLKNKLGGKKDCDKGSSPAPDAATTSVNEEPPQPNPVTDDGVPPAGTDTPTSSQENDSKEGRAGGHGQ